MKAAGDADGDSAAARLSDEFARRCLGSGVFELLLHGHGLAQHRTEIELI
jgi:hypothetical protein